MNIQSLFLFLLAWKPEKKDWKDILKNYDVFATNKEQFIKEINQIVFEIRDVCPYWYGIDTFEIQRRIDMQKFCLISGER